MRQIAIGVGKVGLGLESKQKMNIHSNLHKRQITFNLSAVLYDVIASGTLPESL